jgi:hypothetical protein
MGHGLIVAHMLGMMLAWAVVVPAGIVFASKFKQSRDAGGADAGALFNKHQNLMWLATSITLVCAVLGFLYTNGEPAGHWSSAMATIHSVVGVLICLLMLGHVIWATQRPEPAPTGEETGPQRSRWESMHKNTGYTMFVLAVVVQAGVGPLILPKPSNTTCTDGELACRFDPAVPFMPLWPLLILTGVVLKLTVMKAPKDEDAGSED